MNNPALEHPGPVYLKTPKNRKMSDHESSDWYIPSDGYDIAVELEDEPISVPSSYEGLIHNLRNRYKFRDDESVRQFLRHHPFLIRLLFEAHKEIRQYFGGSRLVLKVVADPEAEEDADLFILVQTALPPKAARALLAVLDQEWWLGAMLEAKGEMTISLEYV